jgi:hypothetical protein
MPLATQLLWHLYIKFIINELCFKLVSDAIRFPTGQELDQVIADFEDLCGVPMCAGALDGTFIRIKKTMSTETPTIAIRSLLLLLY